MDKQATKKILDRTNGLAYTANYHALPALWMAHVEKKKGRTKKKT